jgi:7,8-dihydropterin-6-yl-methyl-4-(beta-D-ribofuranosyl)aminobenzene 5'-phosphate synthase
MKITVLTENTAGGKFLAEHGLSYLIEIDGQKILFDTGHSDVFLKNASQLGIDIQTEVETVALSHGHWDHGDGLQFLQNKKLVSHPGAFIRRFRKRDFSPVGLSLSRAELKNKFELAETEIPLKLTENLYFLGQVPRKNTFEAQTTSFADDSRNDDFVPDDSALAAISNNQLIVITGCSHSGICNITEHAKKTTGISQVKAVLGGFHLKEQNQQTQLTIDYFKRNKIEKVFPSHCTELPALAAFYNKFHTRQLKTGMILEL